MALFNIPCVLFAGGKSSRMGQDKALLPFGDKKSLAEYQTARLQTLFKDVYISAKDDHKFKPLDLPIIKDELYTEISAPTTGFLNIFSQLQQDAVFVLSVDTPFVNQTIIQSVMDAFDEEHDAFIVRTPSGIHPLCGVYTRRLEAAIVQRIEQGNHKLTNLLKDAKVLYVDIADEEALLNLNTPQEYEKALKLTQRI